MNPSVPDSVDQNKQPSALPLRALDLELASAPNRVSQSAADLLSSLGAQVKWEPDQRETQTPDLLEAARSGLMHLTGIPEQAPLAPPDSLLAQAKGALLALQTLCPDSPLDGLDASELLVERAAIFGLTRAGQESPGGSCRLLKAGDDQWIALNLAREEDLDLLPAWLGEGPVNDPWKFVAERIADRRAEEVVDRARLCGLPACVAAAPPTQDTPWFIGEASGEQLQSEQGAANQVAPLIIDLSSLWAGPLCTRLLSLTGARVIKVESLHRPDGARRGPAEFYDLLNVGKESVALDLHTPGGCSTLRELIGRADMVVESARPRALRQLGICAEQLIGEQAGLTWVSITGYGRTEPAANWVAFGDDAAIAAGLGLATLGTGEPPIFCGDAIADPLTGLHAALAALAFHRGGQSSLLDLSLKNVTAHTLFEGERAAEHRGDIRHGEVLKNRGHWEVHWGSQSARVLPPGARKPQGKARALGADTEAVFEEFDISC